MRMGYLGFVSPFPVRVGNSSVRCGSKNDLRERRSYRKRVSGGFRSLSMTDGQEGSKEVSQQEYYANVGSVIETLREDYPLMFSKQPDLKRFTDNIILRDRNNYKLQGKDAYISFFWALR